MELSLLSTAIFFFMELLSLRFLWGTIHSILRPEYSYAHSSKYALITSKLSSFLGVQAASI